MPTVIKHKIGSGAPLASDLVEGELGIDTVNGRVYTENSVGSIVELGANPAGEIQANAGIALPDSQKATFGASDDLQIYHDGSNSYIDDTGVGDLLIRGASNVYLQKYTGENLVKATGDGAVTLFYDNASKLATTSTGIDVTGTVTADGLTVDGDGSLVTSDGAILKLENSSTALTTDSVVGELQFYANDSSTNATGAKAFVKATSETSGGTNIGLTVATSDSTSATGLTRMRIGANGDLSLYEDTGTTAKFFWDASAESLGIGTSSPSSILETFGGDGITISNSGDTFLQLKTTGTTATNYIEFKDSGGGVGSIFYNHTSNYLATKVNGSERMRIDSSGNLLVGTTTAGAPITATTGGAYSYRVGNELSISRQGVGASAPVAILNQTGDDGQVLEFRKDGTTVGSIGSVSGDTYIVTGDTGLRFWDAVDEIIPVQANGVVRDAAISLGDPSYRFKDLYLSGGVYVKTTSADPIADNSSGMTYYNTVSTLRLHGVSAIPLAIGRGTTTGQIQQFYYHNGTSAANVGNIAITASSTSYNTSSDYRLKENVVPMDNASSRVLALKPCRFNFIADPEKTVDGFLAHEAQEVVPEAVHGTKDAMRTEEYEVSPAVLDDEGNVVTEAVMGTREVPDYQGIDQSKLVPLLTKALQEALTEIESLKARLDAGGL